MIIRKKNGRSHPRKGQWCFKVHPNWMNDKERKILIINNDCHEEKQSKRRSQWCHEIDAQWTWTEDLDNQQDYHIEKRIIRGPSKKRQWCCEAMKTAWRERNPKDLICEGKNDNAALKSQH